MRATLQTIISQITALEPLQCEASVSLVASESANSWSREHWAAGTPGNLPDNSVEQCRKHLL
jgi:hypothetical protein